MSAAHGLAARSQADARSVTASPERRRLRQEMRQAAADSAFALWLQPRYRLADGALCGAEAQTRWPHRGSIGTPASFMPLAEECGLAEAVTGWTLGAACRTAQTWQSSLQPTQAPYVAVTIPSLALSSGVIRHISLALAEAALPPTCLRIELNGTGLAAGDEDLLFMLAALADGGIGAVFTGFGGVSADLLPLKLLPLSALKLDRSLIRDLPHDQGAGAVTQAAAAYAHALGITVIAEGVETEAQRDFLHHAGCDEAQGTLFGGLVQADQLAVAALR